MFSSEWVKIFDYQNVCYQNADYLNVDYQNAEKTKRL